MEQFSPLLMVAVMAALVIGVMVAARARSRRRREGMADWARRRGWQFQPQADERERAALARLPLFERGRRRRIENP